MPQNSPKRLHLVARRQRFLVPGPGRKRRRLLTSG